MKSKGQTLYKIVALAILLVLLSFPCISCNFDTDANALPDDNTNKLPENCEQVTDLFSVKAMLNEPEHPCYDWVYTSYGRVGNGGASAVILTNNTPSGVAMLVTAGHVLKSYDSPAGLDIPATFFNPTENTGFGFFHRTLEDSAEPADKASATFSFFHPFIPAKYNGDAYSMITPRYDFYALLADSQLLEMDGIAETPDPITNTSPEFFDPLDIATSSKPYADAQAGDLVLMMGYPSGGDYAGQLAASVGQVLDNGEIGLALSDLQKVGDEEGGIAYDAEAEIIVYGSARGGMSGGGLFDTLSHQVGILVRASISDVETPIVRAVRLQYVVDTMQREFNALPEDKQEALEPYMGIGLLE